MDTLRANESGKFDPGYINEYQGHRESLFRTIQGPRLTWNCDFVKLNRISIFKILTKNIIVYGKDVDRLGFSAQLN